MTKLAWDQTGDRVYETGLDRGVLYLQGRAGVPWNGLTSLEESFDDTSTPLYYDGVKYHDLLSIGDFAAKLTAFTYPEEVSELEGDLSLGDGLYVDGQSSKAFHLSYRTLVGNDTDGTDLGYRIHILYNLTAIPDDITNTSVTDSPEAMDFNWSLTSVPEQIEGYRPTAHIMFDSRLVSPDILENVEILLYGSDVADPTVFPLEIMAQIATLTIIDFGNGIWGALGPDTNITMTSSTSFQIASVEGSYSDPDTYTIQSTP